MSSGVEFDEDSFSYTNKPKYSNIPGSEQSSENEPAMVKLIMKAGLAKSPKVAQGILAGIAIIIFFISYFIYKYFG